MYELINNIPIQIKEYKGQRVVTFKDIDKIHDRPEGTAHRNFKANRKRFIEEEDFFFVKSADIQKDEIRPSSFEIPNRGIILITESGYIMLVKSFTDDLAWDVQRQLVNTYFRAKEINNSYDTRIYEKLEILERKINMLENNSDVEKIVNTILDKKFKAFTKASDRKIRTVVGALNKNSEKFIIESVSETAKSLIPFFDSLYKMILNLCNKRLSDSKSEISRINNIYRKL